ncbi:universal stress protein [soil metagenome]
MTTEFSVQRILVPLDGSEYGERALPWAKALAVDKAEVILLEVVPAASEVRDFRGRVISSVDDIAKGFQELARSQLDDARSRWFPDRETVTLVIAEGDPTEQILWAAVQHNADLIVMSSQGRGAIGRFASGSVADRVVRHAPIPVMVVGPESGRESEATITRIVAPTDGSPLSLSSLPVAAGLAKHTNAPVKIVHVRTPSIDEFPAAYHGMAVVPAVYSADFEDARQAEMDALINTAVSAVKAVGAEASGDSYTGTVVNTINELLLDGDILVIASHGRKGIPRWVLGSTAMKLIQSGSAPLVVVTRDYLEAADPDAPAS